MLKEQIRTATKEDIFYLRESRAHKCNYVLMLKKKDTALYCSSKARLKELVKRYGIKKEILIFGWSPQKRYELYKIEHCI